MSKPTRAVTSNKSTRARARVGHGREPVDRSPSLPPLPHRHNAPGPITGADNIIDTFDYPTAPQPPTKGRLASFVRERAGRYKGL